MAQNSIQIQLQYYDKSSKTVHDSVLYLANTDKQYNQVMHITSDLRAVTCPVLKLQIGTLECNTSASPVYCTQHCPAGYLFESGGVLKKQDSVTCNTSSAQWSHMSAENPLGVLPKCAGIQSTYDFVFYSKIRIIPSASWT